MRLGRKLVVFAVFAYVILFYPQSPNSDVSLERVNPCDDDDRDPSILCLGDIAPDITVAPWTGQGT